MKLTERDQKMFQTLNEGSLGKQLVDYLERMQNDICDLRNLNTNDPNIVPTQILGAQYASDVINRYLIDKIRLRNKNKDVEKNPYQ